MAQNFQPYSDFLASLKTDLGELTTLIQQKTVALEKNDMPQLEYILHPEQAIYLTLRGYAQKQQNRKEEGDFADVPLAELAAYYPEEMQQEVAQTTDAVLQLYQKYQKYSNRVHMALEVNLEHIEKIYEMQMALGKEPSAPSAAPSHNIDRKV